MKNLAVIQNAINVRPTRDINLSYRLLLSITVGGDDNFEELWNPHYKNLSLEDYPTFWDKFKLIAAVEDR